MTLQFREMYQAAVNSEDTMLITAITATATVITVDNAAILQVEPPNLLVIGGNRADAETVRLIRMDGNTLTVQRGFEGTARAWATNDPIARNHTAYDHNTNIHNLRQAEQGIIAAQQTATEAARLLRIHQMDKRNMEGEAGSVTLTNSLSYPFNNSIITVALRESRITTAYVVDIVDAVVNGQGSIGRLIVFDKLVNGFKVAYTGGAASVTVHYEVRGGMR